MDDQEAPTISASEIRFRAAEYAMDLECEPDDILPLLAHAEARAAAQLAGGLLDPQNDARKARSIARLVAFAEAVARDPSASTTLVEIRAPQS